MMNMIGFPAPRVADFDSEDRGKYRLRLAETLLRDASIRSRVFDPQSHQFGDPSWNIMMTIYVSQCNVKRTTVSDAALASFAPPTTGLRHATTLINAGLLHREPDWRDRRKSFLSMTEAGLRLVENYLDRAAGVWATR